MPDVPLVPDVPLELPPLPGPPQASQTILCGVSFITEQPPAVTIDGQTVCLTPTAAPNPAARLSIGDAITVNGRVYVVASPFGFTELAREVLRNVPDERGVLN